MTENKLHTFLGIRNNVQQTLEKCLALLVFLKYYYLLLFSSIQFEWIIVPSKGGGVGNLQ